MAEGTTRRTIGTALLLLGALSAAACKARRMDRLEQLTGITLPADCGNVIVVEDSSDVKAWWVTGHATIPPGRIETFLADNGFEKSDQDTLIFLPGLERLPADLRKPADPKNLYIRRGELGPERSFEMMLDATSGSLWIMATFPD